MKRCPSSAELGSWLAGELAGAEGVDAHIEACATCQQALERLTDDVAVGKGRAPASESEAGEDFLLRLERGPPTETWPRSRGSEQSNRDHRLPGLTVAVAAARGSQSAEEIQTLLRKRLLVMAVVLCFAFAIYGLGSSLLFTEEPLLPWLSALLLALSATLASLLRSGRPLSLRQLRGLEVVVFAALAALFTWVECRFFPYGLFSQISAGDTSGAAFLARGLS